MQLLSPEKCRSPFFLTPGSTTTNLPGIYLVWEVFYLKKARQRLSGKKINRPDDSRAEQTP